ncbi:MAG: Zn-ribbon domain-containing OB-fold protein [Actinomycetota bacterium]|mgnify:FL=1|nr:Zn-ribbon domain-containing OB-fold protein [Actinomycetota bacterium]MEE3186161.1 Zn-ribbon domain-containing OB-fold protein [Actinomycetota bacterium]
MTEIDHPSPHASWETRGYWEGAGRGALVLQKCGNCSLVQHRPRGVCAHCLKSADLEHFPASGRGEIYSYTVTEQNQAKGFAEACPYVMAYVTLEEGPRLLTVIVDCDPDVVTIGMPVVAGFVNQERDDREVFAIPVFRPSAT